MRFLVDAQLPIALVQFIRCQGHDAFHVLDIGMLKAEDRPIWNHADHENAIVVTKDEDFSTLRMLATAGPAVVWLRVGNCSNRALIQWLGPLWPDIVHRLESGEILIEVV